jgi:hypothetical protein
MAFTVYPKEGEPFELDLRGRLAFNEDGLKVISSHGAESSYIYLSMKNIAAILPGAQGTADAPILFHVYLKGKETPLVVSAHAFNTKESPSIRFYWNRRGRDEEVKDIYVALSEVVAILPADPSEVVW